MSVLSPSTRFTLIILSARPREKTRFDARRLADAQSHLQSTRVFSSSRPMIYNISRDAVRLSKLASFLARARLHFGLFI